MTEVTEIRVQLEAALAEAIAYEAKPNKSISKRLRKVLGEIKKGVTPLRAKLVKADSAGY